MTGPMPERGEASVPSLETAREFSGNLLILLAGLAAIGTLSTNIILPSFASMASDIGVPARELGLLLSSFSPPSPSASCWWARYPIGMAAGLWWYWGCWYSSPAVSGAAVPTT